MTNIDVVCSICKGTGELWRDGPFGNMCGHCGGTGTENSGDIVESTGIFRSYEILEALDVDEYNALTATQKDGVKVLLSCGLVDLNDGKAGRVRLWNWFGAESTTVANLTALLS